MKAGAAVKEEELAGKSGMKQTKKKEEGWINRLNSQRHLREECLKRKKFVVFVKKILRDSHGKKHQIQNTEFH